MRLREHPFGGTVTNVGGLSAAHETLSSAELVKLPELAVGDDYYTAVIDPAGTGNGPEIIYITVHSAGATPDEWATIIRGREGTTGVVHAQDAPIIFNAPLASDFIDKRTRFAIDLPKLVDDDTPDDEFPYTDGDLDAKWTLTAGTPTNVEPDFRAEGVTARQYWVNDGLHIYQQGSGGDWGLGQDYTLVDGASITAKVQWGGHANDFGGVDSNVGLIGLMLNDSDTSPRANDAFGLWIAPVSDIQRLQAVRYVADSLTTVGIYDCNIGVQAVYLRIFRDGLRYNAMYSNTGQVWHPLGGYTHDAAYDNLWIFCHDGTSGGDRGAQGYVSWVRLGDHDIQPW